MTEQNNDGLTASLGFNERIGELEVHVGTIHERLSNNTDVLSRILDTQEHQTELMSKLLVVQEKQEMYKEGFDKLVSTVTEIVTKQNTADIRLAGVHAWLKGALWAGAGLVAILSFTINQNLERISKIENDFYIPTLRVSPQTK